MYLRGIVKSLILHKSHLFFAADIWVVGVFGGQAWWGLWWSSRRLAAWVEHVHNCVRDSDTGPRPLPLLYLLSPFVHPGQKKRYMEWWGTENWYADKIAFRTAIHLETLLLHRLRPLFNLFDCSFCLPTEDLSVRSTCTNMSVDFFLLFE